MDKVFQIAVFGLAPNEQNSLGSIFKLATSRNRQYNLLRGEDKALADIALVDIDNPQAIEAWRGFSVHNKKIPVIRVTKMTTPTKGITIRRPLTLKRVLETLDRVTIEVLKYVPELVVGAEENSEQHDEATTLALRNAANTASRSTQSGVKALVVDDSGAVRKSMEIQLGLFGMQIDFAETGEAALDFTAENTYDIIFLDIMLPGIDGYKVCKGIRADKKSKQTPVIMLTGKGSRFDKLKGAMAGASIYLTKPVVQEQLHEVIGKYLPQLAKTA
jgi:twitching motility two-component system response regulator PilG